MEYISQISLLNDQNWIEATGWIGALLTVLAYAMRTMMVFRTVALIANFFFMAYGIFLEIYPTIALNVALIALNILRLLQIRRDINTAKNFQSTADWATALKPFMQTENFDAGTRLFERGETADKVYLINDGFVRLPEIGKLLGKGELFGEIGFLTDEKQRTLSAVCETDCQLLSASEEAFTKAYYQSPALGMSILRLVAMRLKESATINSDNRA